MLPEVMHVPQSLWLVPEANVLWAQWKIRDQRLSDLCQAGKSENTRDHFFKKKKKSFPSLYFL